MTPGPVRHHRDSCEQSDEAVIAAILAVLASLQPDEDEEPAGNWRRSGLVEPGWRVATAWKDVERARGWRG